ncbi:uncharacterized protein LOC135071614 isoform X2 [Ostrinia nubilalis]|uniref:uncharacterized protein LOC135071614 isoform X2 n=1 Tax=Ostrinia nubilalis TaxID=29057 RepID=UPI0030825135
MRLPRGLLASAALLLALAQHAAAKKPKTHLCPIGFDLAYTTDRKPVCYRLKNTPELFTDKFKDCAGNIFTTELYHSLNLTKTNHVIWTDFKSTYPGGPFVDWSYTDSTGRPFYNTYDVKYDASLGIDVELCVVIDPVSNFTAVECNADERHYRYCFVKPYPDSDERIRKDCKGFDNSTRFFSPASTCLTVVSGAGGGGLRATFAQAKDMCFKRGGTVINGGWRLLNSPVLNIAESRSMYPFPLGFTMTPDNQLLRLDSEFDTSRVPESEWHFDRVSSSPDGRYVAIANETWQLVNSSFIFYKVVCERPVKLEHIKLELSVEKDNDLVLTVDRPIKKNEIRCFTDSMKYYASQVKIEKDDDDYKFHLDPTYDGYYWCMQRDYKNYFVSASNKTLFVKRQEDTLNLYATKIRLSSDYNVKYIDSLHRSWKEKIKQFIFNRTRYIEVFGDSENITEGMLRSFMGEKDVWGISEAEVIRDSRIKRLHLDLRTVLLHIELDPEMKPLPPGTRISLGYTGDGFNYLDVVFMRPAYVCKGFESLPSRKLGESETPGCSVFTCVGDFNEGVQWLETAQPDCTPTTTELVAEFALIPPMPTAIPLPNKHRESSSSSSESSEIRPPPTPPVNVTTTEPNNSTFTETTVNITNPDTSWSVSTEHLSTNDPTEVSTVNTPYSTTELSEETTESPELPSTTQRPPQEQLNEVITELENLLLNGTVTLESLERPFDQVNEILDVDDGELEIPSDLLHLLDQLASTAILDGEARAIKVRNNVALMMADATPDNPVRGVRVLATTDARGTDVFTNATFDFLEGELTSSELLSSESEAVVYLPESVTREARRICFVAFRNERAFQSDYSVNSRVFSVNVENLTHFERGEVKMYYESCETEPVMSVNETLNAAHNKTVKDGLVVYFPNYGDNVCAANIDCYVDAETSEQTLTLNVTDCTYVHDRLYKLIVYPKDRVGSVLENLNHLLEKESLSITSEGVHSVFDQVDVLMDDGSKEEIPGELLHGLDEIGTRFELERNHTDVLVRNNIAVLVADSTPDLRLRGMRIVATAHDAFTQDAFEFITEENEDFLDKVSDKNEAIVLLPHSATAVERRISLVAFRTNRSFTNDHSCQLNSKVLSVNVNNFTEFENDEVIEIYLNPWKRKHRRNQTRACAYWHFNENGTGFWSQEGCTLTKARQEDALDLCQCNHLTHFAEILINKNVFEELDENLLEIISIIGCSFSIFGIFMIALTAAFFKSWRENESNKIWLHLCSAVFILDVCFLLAVFVDFDDHIVGCVVVGASLHYSVLATFCWMLVVSILSYRKLVLVFNTDLPCKLLLTALFAWGFPLLVIGILFSVDPNAYLARFEDMTPNGKFCYPKGIAFWTAVFAPMAAMWFVNWILYAIILRSMFETKKNIRRHSSSKETLRCASVSCLLAFLCGIPWVFGFFAYNIVAAYLFTITVSFQGFVLFLFFIVGNKNTRGLWVGLFRKPSRRSVFTASTDRSNKDACRPRFLIARSTSSSTPDQASGSLLSESRL